MRKAVIILVFVLALFSSALNNPTLFPKKLWVYWHTPIESAPFFVKLCVQKMRMSCAEANWTLYVLNDTNLAELLPNYQTQFLPVKNNAKHPGWWASVADLIRLAVIDQNGGLYLDISTILFQGLNWLQRLEKFPHLLTNSEIQKGQYPEVLQSYLGYYQSSAEYRDQQGRLTNYFPGYQSWFLAGKPKSPYINALRKRHSYHYQRTQQQNKIQDFQKGYYLRYIEGEYLNNQKSAYQVLQETQFQLDKNLTLFGHRINVNKHFKLVGFHAEFGPLTFYLNLIPKQQLLTYTLEQIQQEHYIPINFLLKLTNRDRPYIDDKLKKLSDLAKTYPDLRKDFQKFMESRPSRDQCNNLKFIVEDSVFGHFIKDNKIAVDKKIFPISIQQRNKWLAYCKQTYNIYTTNVINLDNRMMTDFNLILQVTGFFVSQQTNHKINEVLQIIAKYYKQATGHMMGGFSDVEQLYYWRKFYEQKTINSTDLVSGKQILKRHNKPLSDYSFFQLLYLRLKLKVLSNRNSLALNFKIFNYLLLFTCSLALIFFFLSISVKLPFWILKYNIRPLKLIWRCIRQQGQLQSVCTALKEKVWNSVRKLYNVRHRKIVGIIAKLIKFILKKLGLVTLVLAFVIFNSIVCFKYFAVVYLGLIYHQQFTFLVMMIVQILFRKIFDTIGDNTWGLPGLTFGELRRIYLPIYWFALGASIVDMAERVEVRNLALASSLCLALPPLIRQIQIQINRVYHKYELKKIMGNSKQIYIKVAVNSLLQILTKLSSVTEILIISFLAANVLLPNLRFLVYKDAYFIKSFFTFLPKLKVLFFIILVGLYIFELYKKIITIKNQIRFSEANLTQKRQQDKEVNEAKMAQPSPRILDGQSVAQGSGIQINHFDNQFQNIKVQKYVTIPTSRSFWYEVLIIALKVINYSVKLYVFYQLLFNPWQQIIVRNTFTITIQQSLVWLQIQRQKVALKIMALLAIFFINYELEKVLEQTFINHVQEPYTQKKLLNNQKEEQYLHINQQIQKKDLYTQKQKTVRSNKIRSLILVSQTLLIAVPRVIMISTIYSYMKAIDDNKKDLKQKMQGQFYELLVKISIIIFFGFKITKEFIVNWSKFDRGKAINQSPIYERQVDSTRSLELLVGNNIQVNID